MQTAESSPSAATREAFGREFHDRGMVLVRSVLSPEFVARARAALGSAIDLEGKALRPDHPDYAMVLCCALYGGPFLELFEQEAFVRPLEWVLGEGCIVYAYQSSSMPPKGSNYSARIHVDCPRVLPGYVTNVGATILLDDFTAENGASYFLPRSFERLLPPTPEEFYGQSERLIAPAGSVMFFNARQWHAGGENHTPRWRHALTVNACRSWMKQRIDLPRALAKAGIDPSALPPRVAQKLGAHAQPPSSYEEYYAPADQRTFRQRTE